MRAVVFCSNKGWSTSWCFFKVYLVALNFYFCCCWSGILVKETFCHLMKLSSSRDKIIFLVTMTSKEKWIKLCLFRIFIASSWERWCLIEALTSSLIKFQKHNTYFKNNSLQKTYPFLKFHFKWHWNIPHGDQKLMSLKWTSYVSPREFIHWFVGIFPERIKIVSKLAQN